MKNYFVFILFLFVSHACLSQFIETSSNIYVKNNDVVHFSLSDANENTTCLFLSNKDTISDKLSSLKKLRVFSASRHFKRKGKQIFELISKLDSLEYINLDYCAIDSLNFAEFRSIKLCYLSLINCELVYIDSTISILENLESIYLNGIDGDFQIGNNLKKLPESIGDLKKIKVFEASDNKLEFIPNSLLRLDNLSVLNLSNNKIRSLPKEILNCNNLKELDLSYNKLDSIPPYLFELIGLTNLDLSNCSILKCPDFFNKFIAIRNIYLSNNPLDFRKFKSVVYLKKFEVVVKL